jgi:uncharacterized membrane protein YvbJ
VEKEWNQMDNMTHCPNCGAAIKPDDEFCANCGFNLTQYRAQATQQSQPATPPPASVTPTQPASTAAPQPPKAPWSKKKKFTVWGIIVLIVVLIGGYQFGNHYWSPQNQAQTALAALKRGNAVSAARYLTSTDDKVKVNATSVKPFLAYIKDHPIYLNQLKNMSATPATNDHGSSVAFIQSGRRWLIFPAYKFSLPAVHCAITTNAPSSTVTIKGISGKVMTGEKKNFAAGPFLPGNYTVTTTATIQGKTVKSTSERVLNPYNDRDAWDLSFKTVTFTATGYPGAAVLINGDQVGKIGDDGYLSIKKYPVTSNNAKMTQVFNANGKDVTSNASTVSGDDESDVIGVSYPGVINRDDASSFLSQLFETGLDAGHADNTDAQEQLATYYTDSKSNKYYSGMIQAMSGALKSDGVDSVRLDTTLKHVYPLAKNKAYVLFDVKWTFSHDEGDHIQVFEYKGEIDRIGYHNNGYNGNNAPYRMNNFDLSKKISDTHEDN